MKNTSTIIIKSSIVLLMFVLLSSCKNQQFIQRGDTLPVAYKKAMRLFQSEKYSDAANAFETIIQLGRGTDYGKKAQYYLGESYFEGERYLLAASEYERYVSLFPRSEDRQSAQFKEAYSYYKLSPRYKLDQSYTRKAIEKFRLYNSRYQSSEKRQEAAQYITEMRAKLAKKLYHAADLYMRIDDYDAAITYYDLTIDKYPESTWAQRSLVDKIKAYNTFAGRSILSKQKERYQKAVSAYETFIQLFPNGEYRSEADEYVDEARAALAELTVETNEGNTTPAGDTGSGY
ncbi:outer membrane protein assembly factor BamD [Fodinibius saliphilus]|uniref:outer membrane protein assembly factor BamD n=1 Tax=Fodinibius saliphilus TaxID=1920650 RepID=UPI001108F9B8|nr:outer membrane protein assembly factor BamD [Fodinibius saliphilus]